MKDQIKELIKQYFAMKDIRRTYSLLKPFILKQWKAYSALLLLLLVDIYLTIAFAKFYGQITDSAIHGGFHQILTLFPYGSFLIMLSIVANVSYTYLDTVATNGVKKDLKNHLYHHILRLPEEETSNLRTGELMAHFSNDIHGVDGVIGNSLITLIRMPIIFIVVFFYLMKVNLILCLLSLAIAPISAIGGIVFGLYLRKSGRMIHKLVGDINSHLNETFQGLNVIRSFTLEKMQYKRYAQKNQELYQLELGNSKLQGWYYTGGRLVGSISFLVNLTVGALFVSKSVLTVGALLTFLNLVDHMVYPVTGIASHWAGFQRSIAALERVLAVLEKTTDIKELPSFSPEINLVDSLQFQNITFRYDENKNVFDHFHLDISAGKVTALVGPSGAGKSTLFNLLQGLYKPQAGTILFDGIPMEEFSIPHLRSGIAHVPQETFLFAGTVRENLLLARPNISEKEMVDAAISAQIHEFIHTLPNGYDTEIGERGIKLSGGQKQRIAIARAILKDAPILLLDEATSALDGETEFYVKEAIEMLMKGRTTIIIAHRLSTILHADVIMVMDQGNLLQKGTHEELIVQSGLYRNLYESYNKSNQMAGSV
ncbi:MAG: ABC transporter ATP-binding protein [Bacillota bacterium]|nr:ABC transporter ATP-binding protein [Bacillota bacterium]